MEQTKKYQKNWMLRAAAVLLCMVLISTWMLSGLMARYASGGSGNDSARTAAFVFHLQDGEETRYIDLSGITRPGDSKSYTFIVSNADADIVSEVAESYHIEIQMNGSLPLIATVKKQADNNSLIELSMPVQGTTVEKPIIQNAKGGTFEAARNQEATYILTVTWPEGQNDVKYANGSGVAEVILTVTAEQAD